MPTVHLTDRALVMVSGPDAEHFLQNILTCDLDVLGQGEAKPGALLTPQGKILFDFLISRADADSFRLECRADIADDFLRRLTIYKLRAKVEIVKQDESVTAVSWNGDSAASRIDSKEFRDLRFPAEVNVIRHHGGNIPEADSPPEAWHRLRIEHGIAESGTDYELGDAFPHDVLLDETGGVGFRKGCYVGQEVVSRMQHRGTARRRVLIAKGEGDLPATGTAIAVDGRAVGTLGSVSGSTGLAVARIDRVKDAMEAGGMILAGEIPVRLTIPAWAKFTFPADASTAGEV